MKEVWILVGHYKRKPSEIMGVYEHYDRGKQALDALGFINHYNEIELKRVAINSEKKFKIKKRA